MYRNSAKVCGDLVQLVEKEVCVSTGLNSNMSGLNAECSNLSKDNLSPISGLSSDRETGVCAVTQWSGKNWFL